MGSSRIPGPEGREDASGFPPVTTPGPYGMGDSTDSDAEIPPADTPGPAGTGHDRSVDAIEITAHIPNGVRDQRTAIYYAQSRRILRLYTRCSNRELIARAAFLSRYLLRGCVRFGPDAQSETARLLIDMEAEMARRLREADMDENGLPVINGITWNSDDPLAGIAEGIPPFGMLDVWTTFLRDPPTQERQRRRRRRRSEVSEIDGDPMVITGQGPQIPPSQVITGIALQVVSGSFAAWFLQHFGNSIVSGEFSMNPSYLTRGGVTRVAFAPPTRREYTQLRRIYFDVDAAPYRTDDILYFSRMKREFQRVVLAWEDVFSSEGDERYQGETREYLLDTPEYNTFSSVIRLNPPEIRMSSVLRSGVARGRT